jgi:hypothetical protein
MKKMNVILIISVLMTACEKTELPVQLSEDPTSAAAKRPTPPPANANPVFAFLGSYYVSKTASVPALYVMDIDGGNATVVYTNYVSQRGTITTQSFDYPSWNSDASGLCFTFNSADIYTLNIAVVNGVPTGSNATKIGDAAGGNYEQSKWRPGQNQVASVFKKSGETDKIHLLSATGGAPTVLHSATSTDWIIENDIAFKSDGSNLAFSERQVSTGMVLLNVLDVNNGQVIKSIDMSQFSSIVNIQRIAELDWAKSPGSNTVAITTRPKCDNSFIGYNNIHQLFTIDVNSATPVLNWIKNDAGCISYSPNDAQITVNSGLGSISGNTGCAIRFYNGVAIYTFATQAINLFPVIPGGYNHAEWRR